MKSRALRRHHRERLWNKRRHYFGGAAEEYGWNATDPRKRMVINTPKLCARMCCSKKKGRAVFGERSQQERRALSVAEEKLRSWQEDP